VRLAPFRRIVIDGLSSKVLSRSCKSMKVGPLSFCVAFVVSGTHLAMIDEHNTTKSNTVVARMRATDV